MTDFGIYVVMTSPRLGYQRFTSICVEEGVPMLQLREKKLCDARHLELACQLREITRGSATRFLIDDRIDICRVADADGVHLGPDDLPWTAARKLLPDKVIGVSTHNWQQVNALTAECESTGLAPDYMSCGPVYPTVAKEIPDPAVGTIMLSQVVAAAKLPVVAIGGIFPSNLHDVISAGARNLAMIRHFGDCESEDALRQNIRHLQSILKEYAL